MWAAGYNTLFTSVPISSIAIVDKEVTYQRIRSKMPSNYKTTTIDEDGSFLFDPCVETLPLIKKNFHHLYYTTQENWNFGWK